MLISISFLIFGLLLILMAAELFTNGVEALGEKFSLKQAVVGSILAAVGTAMPETLLPIVALIFFGSKAGSAGSEIGIGAILGAPFMLATIAFAVVGIAVLIGVLRKKRKFEFNVEPHSASRDLSFFIPMYSAGVFAPLIFGAAIKPILAGLLVLGYGYYLYCTIKGEGAQIEHCEEIYFSKFLSKFATNKQPCCSLSLILSQIAFALALLVFGAHTFVGKFEQVSIYFGMSPLLFALILAPIATELPEKFNSFTWTLKGKDPLAFGNITGAMVFQSTFPVSVGLLFTPWHISGLALLSAIIAIASGALVYISLRSTKKISPYVLLFGGIFYLIYIATLLLNYN